ncbi:MAG: hypothetical protein AAGK66_05990 [Pseudomonadota bacterium]
MIALASAGVLSALEFGLALAIAVIAGFWALFQYLSGRKRKKFDNLFSAFGDIKISTKSLHQISTQEVEADQADVYRLREAVLDRTKRMEMLLRLDSEELANTFESAARKLRLEADSGGDLFSESYADFDAVAHKILKKYK